MKTSTLDYLSKQLEILQVCEPGEGEDFFRYNFIDNEYCPCRHKDNTDKITISYENKDYIFSIPN